MAIETGDPEVVNNATERRERGKCVKCPQYKPCMFDQRRMGAFKGKGIHNVGYRLITDPVEGANGKADFCSCVQFIDSGLQDRMITGRELQIKGIRGEFISICAQEGETIRQGFQVGFNSRNEIIKPMPNLVEPLRKAGYKVNLDDMGQAAEFREVEFERVVPKYVEPNKGRTDYSARIAAEEAQRVDDESNAEEIAWEIAMKKRNGALAKPEKEIEEWEGDDEPKPNPKQAAK